MTTPPASRDKSAQSTQELIGRLRAGDDGARDALFARFLPVLRRWGRGRLPVWARGTADTDDLVQVTLLRAFHQLGRLEVEREGAFLAYLRQALVNGIRDEIRRTVRRPSAVELDAVHEELASAERSLVEAAIGAELLARYVRALETLTREEQEVVILNVEFGYRHAELAEALGAPSANAARMRAARALARLAEAMGGREPGP
jgi:RNA polymerase sigma-70 factor (ECF subfamily)